MVAQSFIICNRIISYNIQMKESRINQKQELLQNLVNSISVLKSDQYSFFMTGYVFGSANIQLLSKNCQLIQRSTLQLIENTRNGMISQTNCTEIIIQSTYCARRQSNIPKRIKAYLQTLQHCLNQVAVDRKYLRSKWRGNSNNQFPNMGTEVDQASLKLIKQFQEEEKLRQQQKNKSDKENLSIIRKMLITQEQQMRKKRQKDENGPLQCQICMEEIQLGDVGTLECGHIFHRKCINDHMSACIGDKKLQIPCPSGCGKILPLQDITQFVDGDLRQKYYKFCFDVYVEKNASETSWCPTPGCTAVFSYEQLDNYRCGVCKRHYCLKCRCDYHYGMSCAEYRINNEYSEDDKKFEQFVRGAKFKQCPKCNFWVQRSQGCSSMACRCGHQFCYDCGGSDCPHGQCKYKGAQKPRLPIHRPRPPPPPNRKNARK